MSFLLDTNVISEWVKTRPDPGVITWLAGVDEDRVFMSVVTLAELSVGPLVTDDPNEQADFLAALRLVGDVTALEPLAAAYVHSETMADGETWRRALASDVRALVAERRVDDARRGSRS